MRLLNSNRKYKITTEQLTEIPEINADSPNPGLDFLTEIVNLIRPGKAINFEEATLKFKALLTRFKTDERALRTLQWAVQLQFQKRSFVPSLTQSGLSSSRGFLHELTKKIKHKILPPLMDQEDFLYIIHHVFYKHHDHIWVRGINKQLWIDFLKLLQGQSTIADDKIRKELNEALHILTQRTVTLGLEKEVIGNYLKTNYTEYAFFLLDQAVQGYLLLVDQKATQQNISEAIQRIGEAVVKCRETIDNVSWQRKEKGTSLSQTYILIRLAEHLERLQLITDLLVCDDCFDADRFVDYFIKIIYYEKRKNSIRKFLSANIGFLTYKITEHGGTRGKKYITVTRQEYWAIIKSSMGGGFIVSFTALTKNILSRFAMPPFWLGFSYSVNYAIGFQLMHETNTTLATKQPAYTASAIATSVDYFRAYEKHGLHVIAIIIARTSRTQLASFFGNLVIVFPMAYGLAALYHFATGHQLLNNKEALLTLKEQHPFLSFSILYACFTGVFLFLSGLIAGSVENRINYGNVGERLRNNPAFGNVFSAKRLEKIAAYVENNLGALIGNIALGFFLGMAGFFGKIFGLPFDIRHITIASGNAAMAYYTTGNAPGAFFLLTVFAGLLLIGLFNFLVSFALAFTVAVRSRGVRLRDYPELLVIVIKYFIRYPADFFFPPRSEFKRILHEK